VVGAPEGEYFMQFVTVPSLQIYEVVSR
jgi:hypothetical protein